ncbi:MAG: ORF6N domain-containing protein [Bacteroidota bacterium]
MGQLVTVEAVEQKIFLIRNCRVMVDRDIAELYGVETKYLNRQVKRNKERFPEEFMFQLTKEEKEELVTNWHRFTSLKHSSTAPFAFTEHGIAMLSAVLNSKRAVTISILIIKAFVRIRELLSAHNDLARKLQELERKYESHDKQIKAVFDAIRQLMAPPEKKKYKVGF